MLKEPARIILLHTRHDHVLLYVGFRVLRQARARGPGAADFLQYGLIIVGGEVAVGGSCVEEEVDCEDDQDGYENGFFAIATAWTLEASAEEEHPELGSCECGRSRIKGTKCYAI